MVNRDKRVYVYFNLHKKCWSVRQSGKIVDHTNQVLLRDCRYLVGQAGRKKVLKEKRKNVHAFVRGEWLTNGSCLTSLPHKVSYNPYKFGHFYNSETEDAVTSAPLVILNEEGRVFTK